jgi:hypothetical protein
MRTRSALVYIVLRLLFFLIPFGILMLFPVFQQLPWLAAVFAALIGLSLSLLLLRRPLHDATAQRTTRERTDEDVEDAAADAAASAPRPGAEPDQPQNAQNNKAP